MPATPDPRIPTGSKGLDEVLNGGLPPGRLYLLEGRPGSGKTTLAMQFLIAGSAAGERVLYITFSETSEELQAVARSHGWSLDGIDIFELTSADQLRDTREQTLLHPWELDLDQVVGMITEQVDRVQPVRIVFDSLSELRLLAEDPLRYRRQVLTLKQYFEGSQTTVILIDDLSGESNGSDVLLHSLCHGVITLTRSTLEFGASRRRLEVQKIRGVAFSGGYHDFEIRRGGLEIFPRLIAAEHHAAFVGEPIASGVAALDALLGGGPRRGTSTLITGPAGTGKTTIAMQYVATACERGEACAVYQFDERVGTLMDRTRSIGIDLAAPVARGCLHIQQVDPAEISPGEFTWMVRHAVEERNARVIVIDSLAGYFAAMSEEQTMLLQIHELLSYLNQKGVVTLLIHPQQGVIGSVTVNNLNASYVADAVLLLRFFEARGRVRKAISVMKNRGGAHEDAIREFRIDHDGLFVGEPLKQFRGVLTGTPEYLGGQEPLLETADDAA